MARIPSEELSVVEDMIDDLIDHLHESIFLSRSLKLDRVSHFVTMALLELGITGARYVQALEREPDRDGGGT